MTTFSDLASLELMLQRKLDKLAEMLSNATNAIYEINNNHNTSTGNNSGFNNNTPSRPPYFPSTVVDDRKRIIAEAVKPFFDVVQNGINVISTNTKSLNEKMVTVSNDLKMFIKNSIVPIIENFIKNVVDESKKFINEKMDFAAQETLKVIKESTKSLNDNDASIKTLVKESVLQNMDGQAKILESMLIQRNDIIKNNTDSVKNSEFRLFEKLTNDEKKNETEHAVLTDNQKKIFSDLRDLQKNVSDTGKRVYDNLHTDLEKAKEELKAISQTVNNNIINVLDPHLSDVECELKLLLEKNAKDSSEKNVENRDFLEKKFENLNTNLNEKTDSLNKTLNENCKKITNDVKENGTMIVDDIDSVKKKIEQSAHDIYENVTELRNRLLKTESDLDTVLLIVKDLANTTIPNALLPEIKKQVTDAIIKEIDNVKNNFSTTSEKLDAMCLKLENVSSAVKDNKTEFENVQKQLKDLQKKCEEMFKLIEKTVSKEQMDVLNTQLKNLLSEHQKTNIDKLTQIESIINTFDGKLNNLTTSQKNFRTSTVNELNNSLKTFSGNVVNALNSKLPVDKKIDPISANLIAEPKKMTKNYNRIQQHNNDCQRDV